MRELYAELEGKVLRSALPTASLAFPASEEVKQRIEAVREQRKQRDAPLDAVQVDAIFATALQGRPEETARRMNAIGLTRCTR